MAISPKPLQRYDLAAMRGWRTVRLDRPAAPRLQPIKPLPPVQVTRRAA